MSDLKNVKNYPELNDNTPNDISEEIYLADTYMTEAEKCKLDAKLIEIENWIKQNVYIEENYIGQSCISTRWVITKKVLDGDKTKARLYARGFEETQKFGTDSPCWTRIGIRTALAVLTTNNGRLKAADVSFSPRKEN